ncbi:hypothetical protein DUI87_17897 [Hirundo rustica rustica]|uniref:Uncharacterized protein n=1 Tax=Hirundo rustica rustica TaxID=333673 RepID=A0A3M0KC26_HIRRU|nr:hypothetical protein DUI87_17897 [Hirundo rustica rustica]
MERERAGKRGAGQRDGPAFSSTRGGEYRLHVILAITTMPNPAALLVCQIEEDVDKSQNIALLIVEKMPV